MSRRTLALWVLAAPLALVAAVAMLLLFAVGAIPADVGELDPADWPDFEEGEL